MGRGGEYSRLGSWLCLILCGFESGSGLCGSVCVPLCRSITGWFGVIAYGVCLVFVGASICVVLLGVVAPAMSCGRFLLCTLLGEGLVFFV